MGHPLTTWQKLVLAQRCRCNPSSLMSVCGTFGFERSFLPGTSDIGSCFSDHEILRNLGTSRDERGHAEALSVGTISSSSLACGGLFLSCVLKLSYKS